MFKILCIITIYTHFSDLKKKRVIRKDVWGLLGKRGIQERRRIKVKKKGEDFSMVFIEEEIKFVYEFSSSLFFVISLGNLYDS
jgi:hypothetical protein